MTPGVERLIAAIGAYGDSYCSAVEAEAIHDATERYDEAIADAVVENEMRYQRFVEEAAHEKRRKIARYEARVKHEIDEQKIRYIDQLLQGVLDYYLNLSDDAFVEFLKDALKKHNGNIKPRVHVDGKHYTLALGAFGSMYQIIKEEDLSNGFVLDFKDYDINYEFEKVFVFKRSEFVQRAMQSLFED